ncbi:hypothetical protein L6654_06375 [Bradyrhizobium sp. WYCCWR 13023]|uniref:Uncharacterized protein n=1 Tax=Bradyrhizobium zhengyangense TaxID=2911009 RepID=A0A9X1U632_9BRAD|nr:MULTISPECIES: hypothetical protein [Bradyrhizobium]MCG2626250.1 hypothetical protein [Bradyrhizobium zhengyangense]MCG2644739.1 hypothetical protein [Bradyrhizobium zhengyangense]MCG2668256.1 hypothetical protein [Bradyrhizobium zhengyangense]MDA9524439.1 hypothetical protein [Bradyrhizobium sp. CCBAU 11434]
MPIIRYFVFVGALLLALLFAASRYLPAPVERAAAAEPDRTIIRITSARRLPDRIVFDTRPRSDLPAIAQADSVAERPQQLGREAMAAAPAAPLPESKNDQPMRFSTAPRPRPKRVAKPSKRVPEPQLAFDRHDRFSAEWR